MSNRRRSSQSVDIARSKHGGGGLRQFGCLTEHERPLTPSCQLAIDLDKNLRVEHRAVTAPPRTLDAVAVAKSVEAVRRSGMLFSRQRQCIDNAIHPDRGEVKPPQLRIHEAHIKIGIVNDELRVADEGQKIVDHACEDRLVLEHGGAMAVDTHCVLGDITLWIDENV